MATSTDISVEEEISQKGGEEEIQQLDDAALKEQRMTFLKDVGIIVDETDGASTGKADHHLEKTNKALIANHAGSKSLQEKLQAETTTTEESNRKQELSLLPTSGYVEEGLTTNHAASKSLQKEGQAQTTTEESNRKQELSLLRISGYLEDESGRKQEADNVPPPPRLVPSNRSINTSVPGAHAESSTGRRRITGRGPQRLSNGTTLGSGNDQAVETPEEHLVTANPVQISTEPAQPIDVERQEENQQRKRDESMRNTKIKLLILGFVLLAVVGIGLAIGLSVKSVNNNKSEIDENQQTVVTAVTTAPTQWTWDLPFSVPKTTIYTIQHDTEGLTPQSKAYRWMKEDPYLDTYSEERLLQRFVMVVFYYSTEGDQWDTQGGGVYTYGSDVTSTMADSQGGVPQRPPPREPPNGQIPPPPNDHNHGLNNSALGVPQRESQNGQIPPPNDHNHGLNNSALEVPPPPPPKDHGLNNSVTGNPEACCVIGSKPPPRKDTKKVNITSEGWLSYEHSECDWFSTVSTIPRHSNPHGNLTVCNGRDQVIVLALMRNHLKGSLPEELGLLTSLSVLVVGRNKMGGPIIPHLGNLEKLSGLHLVSNHFTGTVPSAIGMLSGLKELAILDNDLSGTLPPEVWNLPNLLELKIDATGLSGSFPKDVGNLTQKLQIFMAARNAFSGTIPSSIGKATTLFRISVNDNLLDGIIPSEIGELANITRLHLSNNRFSGVLPTEFGRLSSLTELWIDSNPAIGGPLPSELWSLSRLSVIKLQGTSVSGTIPDSFCRINFLIFDCSPSLCGCSCPCHQ